MSSGCEGGWPGYPYCAYPAPPPPPQWSGHHPHHHHHHYHHHTPDFCSPHQGAPQPPPPLVTYADGSVLPPCPPHYWDGDELIDSYGRVVRRKTSANKKERRRTQSINNAFAELRECIPNVPADTKLSKIKTLRLATSYIAYLMEVLHAEDAAAAAHHHHHHPAAPPTAAAAPPAAAAAPQPFRAHLPPTPATTNPAAAAAAAALNDKDDSDMETEPTTHGDVPAPVLSSTSPTSCSSSISAPVPASSASTSCSSSATEAAMIDKRRGRTGWPETVWAQELKH
ncbi:heart- and neural crest derivatives-expressed protein 1-like [Procambarus clarkii]|uniref:heart- and neural crest derivatives-expressed protein 1-like n=1 Tax=Procambarus clarkii TaxID=6728 RepID=UPI001E6748E5|nr:heart- and neural crest derivatives-expressed protein 1-like [Procambarus clarkii]